MINLTLDWRAINPAYRPFFLDYSNRYEVLCGGAGSGKSVVVAQKLLVKACARVRKVLVIRKYGTTLKDSVFQLICDTLKKWRLYSHCKVNLSTYTITLPNGSIFLFKGLDDSEKIKSIVDITDIWCEESTELSEDDVTQLDLRLRARAADLQMIFTFNPVSKVNWVYRRWFAEESGPHPDTLILRTTYKDNKFLPDSYVKALEDKARTNPNYYRIYALGEFTTLDKLVFSNWRVEDFDHKTIKGPLLIGLDFGFINDVSALVASVLDEEAGKIYVFREWGDTGKTNQELADVIKALGFAKSIIVADAAEQKSVTEIKRSGIQKIKPCTKGPDSIIHGIQRLQNYEIIVHPSCQALKTELENYAWKKDKKTGLYINEPVDLFNHYIDALRYSLQCVGAKVSTLKKAALGL